MGQQFYANPNDSFTWNNGAIGYGSGGSFDCLGPFAKVKNCPVEGTDKRYTCYASGYPDTMWTVPACTVIKRKYVKGYFKSEDGNIVFVPTAKQSIDGSSES